MSCKSVTNYTITGAVLGAGILTSLIPNERECYPTERNYSTTFPDATNFAEECSKRNDLKYALIEPISSECRAMRATTTVSWRFFRDDLCNISILMECCTSPLFANVAAIVVGGVLGGVSGLAIGILRNSKD